MTAPRTLLEVATLRHVHQIASRMRRGDREEIMASGGFRPAPGLRAALRISEFSRTLLLHGDPAAMFGVVVPVTTAPWAVPWLLTTDVVDQHPRDFWRVSKLVLAELRSRYPLMLQYVDARYLQALRWARRLGFRVADEPVAFGAAQLPFHRITLGVDDV